MTAIYGNVKAGDAEALRGYMKWVTEYMGLNYDSESVTHAIRVMLALKEFIDEAEAQRR